MLTRLYGLVARKPSRCSLAAGACAVILAIGVKAFYSRAAADELLWILAPSAWLARFVGGIDLAYEPGAGFISHTHRLVVGAACAGINFLVIAFLSLYFSFARNHASKARWLFRSAVLAFGAAIAANGLRIFVSAHLWSADIYGDWLTREEMHRLAGTAIYYGSLLALYFVVEGWSCAPGRPRGHITPLLWYLGVSLGVPLAGRVMWGSTPGFAEHAVWVTGIASLLTLLMFLPSILGNRVFWRP